MKKETIYGVCYERFSDGPNQTEQSIEGQIRDNEKYAKEHGITIIRHYIDRHISGRSFDKRMAFQEMLRDSKKNKFSVIIVWKTDRFGRNREEIAINKYKFRKNGVRIVSSMESIPDGPEGILLESLYEGLAEYYSADLSQKVSRGMRESAIKGRVIGTVTYGYKKSPETGMHIIDEDAAPVIQEAFRRYYHGELVPAICKDFTKRGILRNGKPFVPAFFYKAFRNRKYIGEYIYDGVLYEDKIPAIIEKDVFEGVQKRLENNSKHFQKYTAKVDYLLSGKLVCGYCGSNYVGESGKSHTGTKHYYYKCHGKKTKKTTCSGKNFQKDKLEDFVIQKTIETVLYDDVMELISASILELSEQDEVSFTLNALYSQKRDVDKSISNLMKAIEAGILTSTTKNRLLELEQQRDNLTIAISQEELKKSTITIDHILFWLSKFKSGDIKSPAFCKTLVEVFINRVFVYNDKLVIAYNFSDNDQPITFEEFDSVVRTNSPRVDLTGVEPVSKNQSPVLLRV